MQVLLTKEQIDKRLRELAREVSRDFLGKTPVLVGILKGSVFLLADLMREASNRTQLIVATHADRLVRFLDPSEVIVLDIEEDGTASATWAQDFDLDQWLEEYTLDEVWRLGRMGGRP